MKREPILKGLKRLRESKKLTQEVFAQLLGVSVRQVCRWETQAAQPRTGDMEARICEILGCTTAELRGWNLSQAA